MTEPDINATIAELFGRHPGGQVVLAHWVRVYVQRSAAPDTSNEELRHIEAQRQFVLQIKRTVDTWLNQKKG